MKGKLLLRLLGCQLKRLQHYRGKHFFIHSVSYCIEIVLAGYPFYRKKKKQNKALCLFALFCFSFVCHSPLMTSSTTWGKCSISSTCSLAAMSSGLSSGDRLTRNWAMMSPPSHCEVT